jgi:hypothetical protein
MKLVGGLREELPTRSTHTKESRNSMKTSREPAREIAMLRLLAPSRKRKGAGVSGAAVFRGWLAPLPIGVVEVCFYLFGSSMVLLLLTFVSSCHFTPAKQLESDYGRRCV